MEEAQELAGRAAIIAQGEIVAEGTPAELAQRDNAPARISFRLPGGLFLGDIPGAFDGSMSENGSISFSSHEPVNSLNKLTEWALSNGVELEGLEVRRPSLEDVYLELTESR
jgi:ABC-2 type transport system ATP-binding protein